MTEAAELRDLVDLHHHVLPGVDDGAEHLEHALAMVRAAAAEGIGTIVATPHTFDGSFDVARDAANAAHETLRAALAAAGIDVDVRLAAELHLHEDVPALLRADPGVSLDGRGRYILLELPHQGPPPGLDDFLFRLLASGTVPVIAHPERNLAVRKAPELAARWASAGALLQLTGGSFTGAFGAPIQDCAERLLEQGSATVVATDAHSLHKRPPLVRQAFAAVAALAGAETAERLFVANPRAIVAGEPTTPIAPGHRRQRRRRPRLFESLFR